MSDWLTEADLAAELGEELAARLIRHATHTNAEGELVLERDRAEDLLRLQGEEEPR